MGRPEPDQLLGAETFTGEIWRLAAKSRLVVEMRAILRPFVAFGESAATGSSTEIGASSVELLVLDRRDVAERFVEAVVVNQSIYPTTASSSWERHRPTRSAISSVL